MRHINVLFSLTPSMVLYNTLCRQKTAITLYRMKGGD